MGADPTPVAQAHASAVPDLRVSFSAPLTSAPCPVDLVHVARSESALPAKEKVRGILIERETPGARPCGPSSDVPPDLAGRKVSLCFWRSS